MNRSSLHVTVSLKDEFACQEILYCYFPPVEIEGGVILKPINNLVEEDVF